MTFKLGQRKNYSDGTTHYYYVCDAAECEQRSALSPIADQADKTMQAWRLQFFNDVHLCPECRKKYEQSEVFSMKRRQAAFDKANK